MASWKSRQLAGPAAAAVLLACALAPSAALGAAGDLDPSFSEDGRLSLVAAGPFVARAVATTPDGGVVVAGYSCAPDAASDNGICQTDGDSSFRLARFTRDGGLDTEFGDKGLVTTPVGVARSQAFDLLLTADGGIVAGGVARDAEGSNGRDTFALVRYRANGALDADFGTGGAVLTRVGSGFAAIADLAEAPDGSIVAVGQGRDAEGLARVAIARYSARGALDKSFAAPLGYALVGTSSYSYGLGASVLGDGSVVAGGLGGPSSDPAGHRFAAVRVNASGAPEATFDGDGTAEYTVGGSSSFANALAARADGVWVAAGAATASDGRQVMAVVRGLPGGGLDASWDGDGVALTRVGNGSLANDVLLLGDGRVVAVGQATSGDGYGFALARYTPGGGLDPAFGAGGTVSTGWTNFPVARGTAGALLPDGRLVVAGIGCQGGTQSTCQGGTAVLLLARYLADPPPPPPPPPPGAAADTRPPAARFVSPRATTLRRRRLLARGLMVAYEVDEEAALSIRLLGRGSGRRVASDSARRRPRSFRVILSRRSLGFDAGLRRLRLKPRRSAIGRTRRFTVRVEITLRDRAGNVTKLRRAFRIR